MITVVIFDLDGVLVDSQPLQYQSYNEIFTKYGHPLTKKHWLEWIHHGMDHKKLIEREKLAIDPNVIHTEKMALYAQLIDSTMLLKPGVKELINRLVNSQYRLCIASASRIESIEQIVKKFNMEASFEYLLSDRDIQFPKPHPHIFLEAARLMGVLPEECAVIEDSLTGLKAAKAALMRCIICPDPWGDEPLPDYTGADVMVKSLDEVTLEMLR